MCHTGEIRLISSPLNWPLTPLHCSVPPKQVFHMYFVLILNVKTISSEYTCFMIEFFFFFFLRSTTQ